MTSTTQIIDGAIVITAHQPGFFQRITRITTDGRASCSAMKKYFRNPGHKYFEEITQSKAESILASNLQAENLTCWIRN